jgi:hypothetical protein
MPAIKKTSKKAAKKAIKNTIKNAYPELPELEFAKTSVAMTDVVTYMSSTAVKTEIKRAGYVMFRNESGNGKKGVNNNYVGLQADGGRLPDKWTPFIAGTCVLAENKTGKLRRFVCLKDWKTSVDILFDRVGSRGLFVGGFAHPHANMQVNSDDDWPLAYYREWVKGDGTAKIPPGDKNSLLSLYKDAVKKFS